MRFATLTLHGQRGGSDRTPIVFPNVAQALQYLQEINDQRATSGLGPATASLALEQYVWA